METFNGRMFDGSPHFFKIMVGDFAKTLYLPPAFAQKIRNEIGNGKEGVLEGPRGMQWDVKLFSKGDGIALSGAGWEIFVYRHGIEFGDFLVFKYIYGTYFRARIFGKNGCEKDIPIIHSEKDCNSQRKCPDHSTGAVMSSDHLMNRKSSVKLKRKSTADAENEVKKPKLSAQSHSSDKPERFHPSTEKENHQTVKSAKIRTEEMRRKIRSHYVSSRRPVSTTEKKKALKAAKSFVSENPFGLVVMRPSMVYHEFRLGTLKAFIDKLELPRERINVTLVDPNRREWPVRFLGNSHNRSMMFGWRCFSIANNLEEGDACVFERVNDCKNKIKLNVHIFPVIKECTPYKYRKYGKRINSPPVITKNRLQASCNKFSTNLSEKAFASDKRKCMKQGIEQLQGEKENTSNGSKCINLYTLKCKTSIPERKASCRRSLRLGQARHLAKFPKKKVWDDKNVVILS